MAKKRTVSAINSEIAALEKEREELVKKELEEKFEELSDILLSTTLTIPQIKKAIKDAEGAKTISSKKSTKNKTTMKEEDGKEHTSSFKPKKCELCGKEFIPRSGRQKRCDDCKNGSTAPSHTQESEIKEVSEIKEIEEKSINIKETVENNE